MSSYAHPEALASTQWVADHLNDPQVRLIEVVQSTSPSRDTHHNESGHIPGAVAWDFQMYSARHGLLDKEGMEALLSRSGITPGTTVVVYSGLDNLLATYTFWLLKIYGHKNTRLLDGYKQKWLDENRPTTSEASLIAPAMYQAQESNWSLRANGDDVLQSIGKKGHLLVDTRSVEMYSGLDKAGTSRGGHIPGAVNLAPLRETNPDGSFKRWRVPTVQPDGTFKSTAELQALFDSLGITSNKEIIT